ncbi:MAG: hypothetical protein LBH84_08955 [Prevotellaceae bacterium]|nr:hypothetical protein [Prevotellaceae bacterium]
MKRNYLKIAVVMAACASVMIMSCKGPKQAASSARGQKMEKDECQKMAMMAPKRAAGTGNSQSERLATNSAALDARTNLQAAIQSILVGMIKNFDQEHQAGAGASKATDFVNQTGEEQKALIDGVLSSKVICSNTYYNEGTGTYTVYACVEMSDESVGNLYKKLSQEKKISIQFEEDRFRKEMEKELENFRSKQ